ncbi:MAG: hypothetical protein AB7Y46_00490 [Armatimonadota bacterium]
MTSRPGPVGPGRLLAIVGALSVIVSACMWAWWSPLVALGYAGGVLTGAGMLSALVFVLGRLVVAPEQRAGPRWPYLLLHLGKLGLAAAFAYLVIIVWQGSAIAFAAGYTVVLIAVLVALGERVDTHTGGPTWD